MTRNPERQHDGKVCYATKGQAKAALSRMRRRGNVEDAELLDVYRCPHVAGVGKHWHVGRNWARLRERVAA